MVDLWSESSDEIRERMRHFARIIQDAREVDQLAELLQLLVFGGAVAGATGRGTGGEIMLRNLLPARTAELLLRPVPGLEPHPKRPTMEELRAGLHPEFPPTRERKARLLRERKRATPSDGHLGPSGLERSDVLKVLVHLRAEVHELDGRVSMLEGKRGKSQA